MFSDMKKMKKILQICEGHRLIQTDKQLIRGCYVSDADFYYPIFQYDWLPLLF